ncbi:hypothetical protein [Cupriavidus metallidurans]|uniref:hypothetical protein n=1 Tax=Cupriavidus metallidurans TaxID=119219 RepID=UPI001CCFF8E1|nr:hypothetical protein [Cupriavidus metallidurans]UBM09537.1 hypothetical protein LAI70_09470 [Cupriavidus metallidurans]
MTMSTATLAGLLLQHMHRWPGRGYVANNLARQFRIPSDAVTVALEDLVGQGKLTSGVIPPRSLVYFVRNKAEDASEQRAWRELRGWEAGLRDRQVLCELTRQR